MKSAFYHQEGKAPQEFAVLAKHEDGTVDLGPKGGQPVVTRCPIATEPKFGAATVVEEKEAEPANGSTPTADAPKDPEPTEAKAEKPTRKK